MNSLIKRHYSLDGEQLSVLYGHIVARECLTALRTASSIIDAAEKRAEAICNRAADDARASAEASDLEVRERLLKLCTELQRDFANSRELLAEQAGGSLFAVVAQVLDKLCMDASNKERLEGAVRMTLRECMDVGGATVRLSPVDKEHLTEDAFRSTDWQVEFSERVHPGECHLQAGTLEWKTSLTHAANVLRECLPVE